MNPFKSILVGIHLAYLSLFTGRGLATNTLQTPLQLSNGTDSLFPDAAITIENAVVGIGSDDRHFAAIASAATVPLGVVLHDVVSEGDVNSVKKEIAIFGLYPHSLPVNSSGAIAANGTVVCDPANPGQVMALPGASGSYIALGRSRYTVAGADVVTLIHTAPYKIVQ